MTAQQQRLQHQSRVGMRRKPVADVAKQIGVRERGHDATVSTAASTVQFWRKTAAATVE